MTFSRANALGFALYETFYSPQANTIDINQSRAIDGHAGGTYKPSASITVNNALIVNSTGAAAANVTGITSTGKGTGHGVLSTGGTTSGVGVWGIGGAPHGDGVYGQATGDGVGCYGVGASVDGFGVAGFGPAGVLAGTYTNTGVLGVGGGVNGYGVVGEGAPGVYGVGLATGGVGVQGQGVGLAMPGIYGVGSVAGSYGVIGEGSDTSAGVRGTGGAAGGIGVSGLGRLTAAGVYGTGGADSGNGVRGIGGAPAGDGVYGAGTGTGTGVYGEGGTTSGYGGYFVGGAPNGIGVDATGAGTGVGASFGCGASGANLRLRPKVGDPTAPAEGDIWSESGDDELIGYFATRKHQLLDTWANIGVTGGAPPTIAVNDQNNVGAPTAAAGYIRVPFSRSFRDGNYAVAAIADGDRFATIVTQNLAYVDILLFSLSTGAAIDMMASSYQLRVIVKGLFA